MRLKGSPTLAGLFILIFTLTIPSFDTFAETEAVAELEVPRQKTHQIGIGASRFLKVLFSTDEAAYTLSYRLKWPEYSLRVGASFDYETEDGDSSTMAGLGIGFDKNLALFENWEFYYGIDLLTQYEEFSNQQTYKIGLAPFFGIAFFMTSNFSISTEPSFIFELNQFEDDTSFGDTSKRTYKFGLRKIGLIQVNFHF